jgi:hypothetical protein
MFIPHNLEQYPFVAFVCIGKHNYPPLPSERTPDGIKDNLQIMIKKQLKMMMQ